jgi:FlaA1/EpsC-like NDP-sugar epimerase
MQKQTIIGSIGKIILGRLIIMFRNEVILITGATGSWGQELTTQLLEMYPKKIIIFSRGELAQVNMQRKFRNDRLEFIIGDVRDADAVDRLFSNKNIDCVFHLAALKHVPVCENQPQEAIKTNITGTTHLVNSAVRYNVRTFIDVSSDKAVSPTNLYGFTKAVGEKIVTQANNLSDFTNFVCIRGGNVLGSNGSVVPLFIDQIKRFNRITLTSGKMTRFFLTLSEAIKLLFKATEQSIGGETYVMNMPSFYISDLAQVMIKHFGNSNTSITEIGLREGEKMHEVLISEHESPRSFIFSGDYYVIAPELRICRDYGHLEGLEKVKFETFSSSDNIKDQDYLEKLLDKGGFLS